ncbi:MULTISPECIES: hypothetical protein [Aquimarina]|uniref:hypothetical protein n=1 Tax=Aquimarina TaxID=290174 RepID=UPI00094373A5|nr:MULTISPECIES: hypothetical protein [Aquimarina]
MENIIRSRALGRKNYLFSGFHRTTQKAVMLYSLFASCKINIIDPIAYKIIGNRGGFYFFAICGVSQFCRLAISKLNVLLVAKRYN